MVEGSILTLGDNQHAIIEAVHKGFGGKALCAPLLSILRQQVPDNVPEFVTSGWDAAAVTKAGTYKTAEPKEVEPQYRQSTYYVCPHCNCEMTHESIFKDDDGTTRHGPCRGAVVLKDATPQPAGPILGSPPAIVTAMPKAFRSPLTPRFLPGIRRKAMQPVDTATIDENDEFMPDGDAEMETATTAAR